MAGSASRSVGKHFFSDSGIALSKGLFSVTRTVPFKGRTELSRKFVWTKWLTQHSKVSGFHIRETRLEKNHDFRPVLLYPPSVLQPVQSSGHANVTEEDIHGFTASQNRLSASGFHVAWSKAERDSALSWQLSGYGCDPANELSAAAKTQHLARSAGEFEVMDERLGSELSSNESIKQMCAAGFGSAYLSLHTCVLAE